MSRASSLSGLPRELMDMVFSHADEIRGGILVRWSPPEAVEGADDVSQSSGQSHRDILGRAPVVGAVLNSLEPYYKIPGKGSLDETELIKDTNDKETNMINNAQTIFTGDYQVVSDLYKLAVQARQKARNDFLPNLQRVVWDERWNFGFETDDQIDGKRLGTLQHLHSLGNATNELSKLHERAIDVYVNSRETDWSAYFTIPRSGMMYWQGKLSGMPRFISDCTVHHQLVLDVTDYCREDLMGTGPSEEFCEKLSMICTNAKRSSEGSVVQVYLNVDPEDQAAKDRLGSWKDDFKRIAFGTGQTRNTDTLPNLSLDVDLQLYVGEQPYIPFTYTMPGESSGQSC